MNYVCGKRELTEQAKSVKVGADQAFIEVTLRVCRPAGPVSDE